jgi:histone deacetylase complex subunit SAP18
MLRIFIKKGQHHALQEFSRKGSGEGIVTMYTWHDATLREITDLLLDVEPETRGSKTRLSFAFVYPDRKGRNILKEVGAVFTNKPGPDDNKTLHHLQFQTGDILSVATF